MGQWDYGRSLPPELWYLIEGCEAGGTHQSPIDIQSAAATENSKLTPIVAKYKLVSLESFFFTHLHLEVEVEGDAGGVEIQGCFYPLKQFHVHTPAEHVIDGRLASMEVHLVHSDGKRNYVIGVFVNPGDNDHPFIESLVDRLPHLLHKPEALKLWSDGVPLVDPAKVLPGSGSYFTYNGSLTTPPCTENTTFFMFAAHISASERQIGEFRKYVPGGNNRPVQPLNGRVVEYYSQP